MPAANSTQRSDFSRRAGFSLLELLVVVLIIGIIASLIVPRIWVQTDNARDKVTDHHLATLNRSIELYQMDNNAWPTALTDLAPTYLPDGVPTPPHGGSYTINVTSHRAEHTP